MTQTIKSLRQRIARFFAADFPCWTDYLHQRNG